MGRNKSIKRKQRLSRADRLQLLYNAVGYLRAAYKIVKSAEQKMEEAWTRINDGDWYGAGWTKKRTDALNRKRVAGRQDEVLHEARAILKHRSKRK